MSIGATASLLHATTCGGCSAALVECVARNAIKSIKKLSVALICICVCVCVCFRAVVLSSRCLWKSNAGKFARRLEEEALMWPTHLLHIHVLHRHYCETQVISLSLLLLAPLQSSHSDWALKLVHPAFLNLSYEPRCPLRRPFSLCTVFATDDSVYQADTAINFQSD